MYPNRSAELSTLDELSVAVYEWALSRGSFVDDRAADELKATPKDLAGAVKTLCELGLLARIEADEPLVPVDPQIVESELSAPLERDIADRRQTLTVIHHQMRALAPLYSKHRPRRTQHEAFRIVVDPSEVLRELTVTSRHCTEEVLTMQPGGGRNAETLREALVRDLSMLERNVSMRILYQHTARANLATRTYVRQVSEAGAEVRTADEIVERIIIFDRRTAFVPLERSGNLVPGAAIVSEPAVVAFLCRMHDSAWLSGQPFEPDRVEYEQASKALQASILRLMAQGLKDAVIARRVGMATRTCRRYISAIMEDLGTTSRFQGGVRAAQMGLLASDDEGNERFTDDEEPAPDDVGTDEPDEEH